MLAELSISLCLDQNDEIGDMNWSQYGCSAPIIERQRQRCRPVGIYHQAVDLPDESKIAAIPSRNRFHFLFA